MDEASFYAGVQAARSRDAWVQFLSQYPMDGFITVTFARQARYPLYALETVRKALVGNCQSAYLGAEPHYLGGWHVHGVVATGMSASTDLRDAALRNLYRRFGKIGSQRSVQHIENVGNVVGYVTKYITKSTGEYLLFGMR